MTESEAIEFDPKPPQQPQPACRKRHRRKKKAQKQSAALQRKIKFEHVRLNRVILRTTFVVCGPVCCASPLPVIRRQLAIFFMLHAGGHGVCSVTCSAGSACMTRS